MYFTNDSMLPENQLPLVITAAPYGPQWVPPDYPEDIPVTWEEQWRVAWVRQIKRQDCHLPCARI